MTLRERLHARLGVVLKASGRLAQRGQIIDALRSPSEFGQADFEHFFSALTSVARATSAGSLGIVSGRVAAPCDHTSGLRLADPPPVLRQLARQLAVGEQDGQPWPTVAEVIEHVEESAEELVASTTASVTAGMELVEPALRESVLARSEVAAQWPWPAGGSARGALTLLVRALAIKKRLPRAEPNLGAWPAEVAPAEVARWVGERGGPADLCDLLARGELHDRWFDGTVPSAGLALLYAGETAARAYTPRAFGLARLDVERPTLRATEMLVGVNPRNSTAKRHKGASVRRTSGKGSDPARPNRFVISYADGHQFDLFASDETPWAWLRRKYGNASVADLQALQFLSWANGADPTLSWWYPHEHLHLRNIRGTSENKAALLSRLDEMSKLNLRVRYSDGDTIEGPLVAIWRARDGRGRLVACEVRLHRGLYQGVRRSRDGGFGRRWWPIHQELLALDANGPCGPVHALAPAAGHRWRHEYEATGAVSPQRWLVQNLSRSHLGVRGRGRMDKGKRDPEAAETVKNALNGGVAGRLLERWEAEGDLADPGARVVLYPNPADVEHVLAARDGASLGLPAPLPATGNDLRRWLKEAGWSAKRGAACIDLPYQTLTAALRKGERPVPKRVRDALRSYLWCAAR